MNTKIDHRYSLALFNAAIESNCVDAIAADATDIIGLLNSERDLRKFFKSPVVKKEKKINIVVSYFKSKVNSLSVDFMKLLILRNREGMIGSILKEFLLLKDEREGVLNVDIKTAIKVDSNFINKFKTKIDEITNLNSRLDMSVDEDLIGGFTIQFNDTVIDSSLKRQLEIIKSRFREQSL